MPPKRKKARRVVIGTGFLNEDGFYSKFHKDKSWAGGGYYHSKDLIAWKLPDLGDRRVRLIAEILED